MQPEGGGEKIDGDGGKKKRIAVFSYPVAGADVGFVESKSRVRINQHDGCGGVVVHKKGRHTAGAERTEKGGGGLKG